MTKKKKEILKSIGEAFACFALVLVFIFALFGVGAFCECLNRNAEKDDSARITASAEEVMPLAESLPVVSVDSVPVSYEVDLQGEYEYSTPQYFPAMTGSFLSITFSDLNSFATGTIFTLYVQSLNGVEYKLGWKDSGFGSKVNYVVTDSYSYISNTVYTRSSFFFYVGFDTDLESGFSFADCRIGLYQGSYSATSSKFESYLGSPRSYPVLESYPLNYEYEFNGNYSYDRGPNAYLNHTFANFKLPNPPGPLGQAPAITTFTAYVRPLDASFYSFDYTYFDMSSSDIPIGDIDAGTYSYLVFDHYTNTGLDYFYLSGGRVVDDSRDEGILFAHCKVAIYSGDYLSTRDKFISYAYASSEEFSSLQLAFDRGKAQGKQEGYNEGFTAGKLQGQEEAYNNGFSIGKAEGIEEGKKQGYQNGYDDALKEQMIPVAVLTQTTVSPVSDFYMESFTASDSVITWKPKEGAQGGGLNGVRCHALTPLLPNVTYLFRYSSTQDFNIGFWESSYNALTLFPNPSTFSAGENQEVYFTMPVSIYDGSSYASEGTNMIYIYTDTNDYEITIKNASILQVTDASAVYQEGYEAGEKFGYNSGYDTGNSEGYSNGYSAGLEIAQKGSFFNLISAVIDAPVIAFTSLLDFEVFGYNMKSFLLSLLLAALVVCVLRIFAGKGVK